VSTAPRSPGSSAQGPGLPFVAKGELFGVAVLDEPGRAAEFDDERIGVGQAVAGFAAS